MPFLHYSQIQTKEVNTITATPVSYIDPKHCESIKNLATAQKGDIIVTDASIGMPGVCLPMVWDGEQELVTSQHCIHMHVDQTKVDPFYLAYYLKSYSFFIQKRRIAYGSGIYSIYSKDIAKCVIPLPSLKIQQAIGKFLNCIENLVSSKEISLSKEIELRKTQFNYFLDKVLNSQSKKCIQLTESKNLSEFENTSPNYTITKLNDICFSISIGTYLTKKIKEDAEKPQEELIYPVYGSTGIVRYGSSYLFDGTKILVSCIGHTGIVHLAHGKFDVNQNSLIIDLDESKCDFNYLYYYLKTCKLDRLANGGAQKCLTATSVRNVEIKLPPIEQQRNIGKFFSTFDSYINNLEQELSLREQQFEFYLNKIFDQL